MPTVRTGNPAKLEAARKARARLDAAQAAYEAAVIDALDAGASLQAVADAIGYSKPTVAKLARRLRSRAEA